MNDFKDCPRAGETIFCCQKDHGKLFARLYKFHPPVVCFAFRGVII